MKYKIKYLIKVMLYYLFRIFRIKRNKIVFANFSGKRYGDSPKFIAEELHRRDPGLDLVWLMRSDCEADIPPYIRVARFNSIGKIYELATAKVWVDSHNKFEETRKRKKQLYVNTSHGFPLTKKFDFDVPEAFDAIYLRNAARNSALVDFYISNGSYCTEIYRSAMRYKGEILEYGCPRIDVFINRSIAKEKVHKFYHIPENKKLVLYAPTFRVDFNLDCYQLREGNLLDHLSDRFKEEFVLLVRFHPLLMKNEHTAGLFETSESIIGVTDYDDVMELCYCSDVLITDYSGIMYDFLVQEKPCFLFATDIEAYKQDRGFYNKLEDLPFPLAEDHTALWANIRAFDPEKYAEDVAAFKKKLDIREDGKASVRTADLILDWIAEN